MRNFLSVGKSFCACSAVRDVAFPLHDGEVHARVGETVLCFFFQAEDGIRDIGVTGVQTCALPIYGSASRRECRGNAVRAIVGGADAAGGGGAWGVEPRTAEPQNREPQNREPQNREL